jgi:hypothetical protein
MTDGTLGLVLQGCFRVDSYRPQAFRPAPLPGISPATSRGRSAVQPRIAEPAHTSWLAPRIVRAMGLASPLDPELRPRLEDFFQEDLSAVTVHRGPIAGMLGADAVTIGDQIGLGPGAGLARTAEGLWLLAHELSHVLQQRRARVINRDVARVLVMRDPVLDREAAELATRATEWAGRGTLARRVGPRLPSLPSGFIGQAVGGRSDAPSNGSAAAQTKKAKTQSQKNLEAKQKKLKNKQRQAVTAPRKVGAYSPDQLNQAEKAAVRRGVTAAQLPGQFITAAATQPGGPQRIGHASQTGGTAEHPATGGMIRTYVKHLNDPRVALAPNPNQAPAPPRSKRKGKGK